MHKQNLALAMNRISYFLFRELQLGRLMARGSHKLCHSFKICFVLFHVYEGIYKGVRNFFYSHLIFNYVLFIVIPVFTIFRIL